MRGAGRDHKLGGDGAGTVCRLDDSLDLVRRALAVWGASPTARRRAHLDAEDAIRLSVSSPTLSPPTLPARSISAAALAAFSVCLAGCDSLVSLFGTTDTFEVTLEVTKVGEGRVTSSPEGIRLEPGDSAASAVFDLGSEVTLTAEPPPGGPPVEWGRACAGAAEGNVCTLRLDRWTVATALFEGGSAPPAECVSARGTGSGTAGASVGAGGVVSLEPGETHRLAADATTITVDCGVYVLAVYDGRYLRAGPEPPPSVKAERFTVTVGDASATGPARAVEVRPSGRAAWGPARHDARHVAPDHGGHWTSESEPWQPGDTIADHGGSDTPDGVVVRAVVAGFYALAEPVGNPMPRLVLDSMIDTLEDFERLHRPWLERLFDATPGTPNGQLLVTAVTVDDRGGASGFANNLRVLIRVGTGSWEYEGVVYRVFVHEVTHAYDRARRRVMREREGTVPHRERWNAEGLAEHTGYRAAAERHDWPLHANAPPDYRLFAVVVGWGELESGYGAAGGYFWYLADRLAEARGWTWEAAHDSVTIGAADNRWGCFWADGAADCDTYDGIYDLMQRRVDTGWDPAGAVLTYGLLQAVDGLTDNPDLQNPHARHNRATRLSPLASIHSSSGDAFTADLQAGSYAVFELVAQEQHTFRFTSEDPDLHWMVVRID